jgi:hypothetical protein
VQAYGVLNLPSLPSKTKEVAFQILNRTVWTNNKAYKSGLQPTPACEYCGDIETMEHLLYLCPNYSATVWQETSSLFTSLSSHLVGHEVAAIHLTPREIIYNAPHPSLLLHVKDKSLCRSLLLTVQEIKRNLIYRRMNIRESCKNRPMPRIRVVAHIISVIKKILAMYQYKNILTNKSSIAMLQNMESLLQNSVD